jgi:hypothetical protein
MHNRIRLVVWLIKVILSQCVNTEWAGKDDYGWWNENYYVGSGCLFQGTIQVFKKEPTKI